MGYIRNMSGFFQRSYSIYSRMAVIMYICSKAVMFGNPLQALVCTASLHEAFGKLDMVAVQSCEFEVEGGIA